MSAQGEGDRCQCMKKIGVVCKWFGTRMQPMATIHQTAIAKLRMALTGCQQMLRGGGNICQNGKGSPAPLPAWQAHDHPCQQDQLGCDRGSHVSCRG